MSAWSDAAHAFRRAVAGALDSKLRSARTTPRASRRDPYRRPTPAGHTPPPLGEDYPGDFTGRLSMEYAPHPGHLPDPGEVVWSWVPYEEDNRRGKDRPVLLIGRDGDWLLGLPLTSKDHDRDASQEAGQGRYWVDIGTGAWDSRGRASEARTDRVVRVDPRNVRRDGVGVSEEVFERVAREVRRRRQQ